MRFSFSNNLGGSQANLSPTYLSLLTVAPNTVNGVRRIKVYDFNFGCNGTPSDAFIEWDVSRITAENSGTFVAPPLLDLADAAANSRCASNLTVEPSVTANSSMLYIGINERASYSWISAQGGELIMPATGGAGFTIRARSGSYAGTATAMVHCNEQ